MTPIIKIELQDNYLVLPCISTIRQEDDASSNAALDTSSASMAMTSPVHTLSSGTPSISSTLPSSAPSARSSFEEEQQASASLSPSTSGVETTALKGNLILTLSKPAKVSSLAISLNGSTHIAFLGTGKRSHHSRHHIRSQQFLIEPQPNAESYTLLGKDTISYPFSIEIPNHLPPSVTTPQGGTIYRLTAALILAKGNGIMSFLSSGSTFTTSVTVQVYRAPRNRCAMLERIPITSEDGEEEEEEEEEQVVAGQEPGLTRTIQQEPVNENDMLSATVTHTWPGQLETKVAIPFTKLPPMSKPDLHLRVRVLRDSLSIKSFQGALWERVIFRVQKAGAPLNSKKHIIGVRERAVSVQRCDVGWVNESVTSIVPHTFEKVVLFSIPSAIRNHNEAYNPRSTNPSTFTSASKLKKRHLKEDQEIKDSEFGEIHIEVQHFIRYSIFVNGSVDNKGKTVSGSVERNLGDVPVIVLGLSAGPECDMTGLPSYLYSFSTSRVSYEEAQDYELEATSTAGIDGEIRYEGAPGPIYGIYGDDENDDAFMAIMGYRGSRTPPSYEDSVGRPSVEVSISEIQNVRPLSQTLSGGDNLNAVQEMTR